jgi:hypothetical protein
MVCQPIVHGDLSNAGNVRTNDSSRSPFDPPSIVAILIALLISPTSQTLLILFNPSLDLSTPDNVPSLPAVLVAEVRPEHRKRRRGTGQGLQIAWPSGQLLVVRKQHNLIEEMQSKNMGWRDQWRSEKGGGMKCEVPGEGWREMIESWRFGHATD